MTAPPDDGEEIPPAIACAVCGRAGCEGCAPKETLQPSPAHLLPWEAEGLSRETGSAGRRLVTTAELTSFEAETTFGRLQDGSLLRAFSFGFWAEIYAVGSFCAVWGLGFYALFPFAARQMLHSWAALVVAQIIFLILVLGVVFIHALWGAALEWGIERTGTPPQYRLGIRFGLYACGWDLLTSPASLLLFVRKGGLKGALGAMKAGARAPRPAVKAYLSGRRRLDEQQEKKALVIAIVLVSVTFLLFVFAGLVGLFLLLFPELRS